MCIDTTYNRLVNVKLFPPVMDKVWNRKFFGAKQQAVMADQIWGKLGNKEKNFNDQFLHVLINKYLISSKEMGGPGTK